MPYLILIHDSNNKNLSCITTIPLLSIRRQRIYHCASILKFKNPVHLVRVLLYMYLTTTCLVTELMSLIDQRNVVPTAL